MRHLFVLVLIVALYGCASKAANEDVSNSHIEIEHFNIMIAPDLSNRQDNRLYPRPLNDGVIIQSIVKMIYPNILNHRRAENQEDKFSIRFINKKQIDRYNVDAKHLTLDFGKFSSQKERIDYIKGRSQSTFKDDTARLMNEYRDLINKSKNNTFGADIWSFMNSGIDDITINTHEREVTFLGKNYRDKFKNVLILLTDGYIEAEMYGKTACQEKNMKQCYYLSSNRVKQFRTAFKNSGVNNIGQYFNASGYGIVAANNPALKDLEVLVLELYDRSLSTGGVATVHPTDAEILRLFWADWLTKSGVKRFEIRTIMGSTEEVEKVVLNFLNIR